MRDWLRDHPRHALLVGATLLLPALLLIYLLVNLLGLRSDYQGEIERLEPRIARLQGLLLREDTLREAAGTVRADVLGLVYPASTDSGSVSATLQKNVREIFSAAGLEVSNSQILPVQAVEGFDRISVQLTVEGGLPELDVALADLNGYRPLLLVESIEIWPNRRSGRGEPAGQTVSATVQVMALRLHS